MIDAPMHQTLLEAALSGDISSLQQLSDEALNGVAAGGNTAAHIASKLGHSEFLTEILRRCHHLLYRKNSYQDTALHCAARVGNDACIRVLIEAWRSHRRTTPASNDAAGLTPSETGPVEGMGDEKDPPEEKVAVGGKAEASTAENSGKAEVHMDSIPKWANKRGNTALHEAVRKQRLAVVDTLLEADPSLALVTNNNGESAMGIARRISSTEIVEILLKHQTGSSSDLERKSGVHSAAYRDNGSDARRSKRSDNATTEGKKQKRKQNGERHQSSIVINKMIITSVLIATLTFAAAISLPVGSGNEEEGTAFAKKIAFVAFLLFDGVAMVSSVIIILLLVQMGSLDHSSLLRTMNNSMKLVRVAVGCLAVAFGLGVYVAVTFEDEWQAAITCIPSAAVPFVIYTVTWWPTI